ncbi:hypothetical protein CYMTET_12203, partial [Cymbomonas tetramitiformis]
MNLESPCVGDEDRTSTQKRPADCGSDQLSPDSSKKPRNVSTDSTFHKLLAGGGCELVEDLYYVANPRELAGFLESSMILDHEIRQEYLSGLETLISDAVSLRQALVPMSCQSTSTAATGDSLIRTLLGVTCIQTDVATMLLEKLPEFMGEGNERLVSDSVPKLILAQFRWLDHLMDSGGLTEKLLEVLPVCPPPLQREIASFFPEVVLDEDHPRVVAALKEILNEDATFLVPALEAISNMNLDDGLKEDVVKLVLQQVESADVEDLPVLLRFLLQTAVQANATWVVRELRKNLNFISGSDVRAAAPDRKQKAKVSSGSSEASILEALRTGLRFHSTMCDTFLKEIRNVCSGTGNCGSEHKVVDIWVLLVVHSFGGQNHKLVESILRKKILEEKLTIKLLERSLVGHAEALKPYFPSLLAVGESLLRAREESARQFGGAFYTLAFQSFTDGYHRQEVLAALVAHTGSGSSLESSGALEALVTLAHSQAAAMLPFSAFINNLLDYLDGFQDNQLQKLFEVFSSLAVTACRQDEPQQPDGDDPGRSEMQDQLHIVIRKQLSHADGRFKRIGIIGGVTLACRLAMEEEGEEAAGSETRVKLALDILGNMCDLCRGSPSCVAFLCDELSGIVETAPVDQRVLSWLTETVTNEFESSFLEDLDETGAIPPEKAAVPFAGSSIQGEAWFNLDGDESPITLRLLPLAASSDAQERDELLKLCAQIRLMAVLERRTNQSLSAIDALLGCPMMLFPKEMLLGDAGDKTAWSDEQASLICRLLFMAINWVRELLNAFSSHEAAANGAGDRDEDMDRKLLLRVHNLCCLEAMLAECLEAHPQVQLPRLGRPLDSEGVKQSAKKPEKEKSKKPPRPPAGNKENVDASQVLGTEGASIADGATQAASGSTGSIGTAPVKPVSSLQYLRENQHLRALNMGVFSILGIPPRSAMLAPASGKEDLLPLHCYLLRDLTAKVSVLLQQRKTGFFGSVATQQPAEDLSLRGITPAWLLRRLQPLLPALRNHLDLSVHTLQRQGETAADDGSQ